MEHGTVVMVGPNQDPGAGAFWATAYRATAYRAGQVVLIRKVSSMYRVPGQSIDDSRRVLRMEVIIGSRYIQPLLAQVICYFSNICVALSSHASLYLTYGWQAAGSADEDAFPSGYDVPMIAVYIPEVPSLAHPSMYNIAPFGTITWYLPLSTASLKRPSKQTEKPHTQERFPIYESLPI